MSEQRQARLNWLQGHLPDGLLVDAAWLQQHGIYSSLRSKYVSHRWLEQVVRGVYRRSAARLPASEEAKHVSWQYLVVSLQTLLQHRVSVGGRTALELHGAAHYLSASGLRELHLYGSEPLPSWTFKLPLDASLVFHNTRKLFKTLTVPPYPAVAGPSLSGPEQGVDLGRAGFTLQPWGHRDWHLLISTPERAVLELLDELPQNETFHQVDMLIEGLPNLSPRRLHALLTDCRSVKVKRLFLWFAERHNHAWLKKLDRRDIDLGTGKRMLVHGGKLDPKFNITVPENLDARG